MNRKINISLMNPWWPYAFLTITIGFVGIFSSVQQFSYIDFHHLMRGSNLFNGILLAVGTLLFCTRLTVLYLIPRREWKEWAHQHNGQYYYPANLQVQPYGMVLDVLQGIDDKSGNKFILMRAIQTFRNLGSNTGLTSRHFVILAKPGESFNNQSKDGFDLTILKAKQYRLWAPTFSEMFNSQDS